MGANTAIEWATHSWNPWRGCTKVSQGCAQCYADTLSKRNPNTLGIWGPRGTRVVAAETYWRKPLQWNAAAQAAGERHRVFCASLADIFEGPETMPTESWLAVQAARERLWLLIAQTPHLDWLLLTKRPQHIPTLAPPVWYAHGWPDNVWIGTSVENQAAADERIPLLLQVPAAIRFLSCEPLLGPLDLRLWLAAWSATNHDGTHYHPLVHGTDLGNPFYNAAIIHEHPRVDWIIAGGESGPKARPAHPQWFRSLRDQCQAAGVPFFFKQWGEWFPYGSLGMLMHDDDGNARASIRWADKPNIRLDNTLMYRIGKKAAGRLLDGVEWSEVPC
jgi:protein gp37